MGFGGEIWDLVGGDMGLGGDMSWGEIRDLVGGYGLWGGGDMGFGGGDVGLGRDMGWGGGGGRYGLGGGGDMGFPPPLYQSLLGLITPI